MGFFTYYQNNSGGIFELDNDVAEYVIIEAEDYQEANRIAEDIGIYFDGCSKGIDCECCGDRWYETDEDEMDNVPSIYEVPIGEYKSGFRERNYRIHYLNGEIKRGIIEENSSR